jgi:hypothetical protein
MKPIKITIEAVENTNAREFAEGLEARLIISTAHGGEQHKSDRPICCASCAIALAAGRICDLATLLKLGKLMSALEGQGEQPLPGDECKNAEGGQP